MDPAVLEALLFVADGPLTAAAAAAALEVPEAAVAAGMAVLAQRCEGRGVTLQRVAGGWRLATREDLAPQVEAYLLQGQTARLTQAALETLAVVAYLQPVTRARVSAIRGVSVDGVLRTLVGRGLVEVLEQESESGAHRYATTPLFLEKMGLDSLQELPPLPPLLPGHEQAAEVADGTTL